MTGPEPAHPTFFLPSEVAATLRCSEWWVKEQARQHRIPFCWIGGGYKFTAEHVAEIARLFEVRPIEAPERVVTVQPIAQHERDDQDDAPPIRLTARVPRRARVAA